MYIYEDFYYVFLKADSHVWTLFVSSKWGSVRSHMEIHVEPHMELHMELDILLQMELHIELHMG